MNYSFHNPLHRRILAEAESHLHDQNFTAERYFLAHPDPTISKFGGRDDKRPLPTKQISF